MNILIIHGHPVKDTFSACLIESYKEGAAGSGADVKILKLNELQFNINFTEGYRGSQELESDLLMSQKLIKWADHLVFIYPNWWSTFPALLKGFIDRTFLPGFAFRYKNGVLNWDKLLTGKTARLIITMDTPTWYYRFKLGKPGHRAMKKGILEFCGIKPVRITTIGSVRKSNNRKRNRWIQKVRRLGIKMI